MRALLLAVALLVAMTLAGLTLRAAGPEAPDDPVLRPPGPAEPPAEPLESVAAAPAGRTATGPVPASAGEPAATGSAPTTHPLGQLKVQGELTLQDVLDGPEDLVHTDAALMALNLHLHVLEDRIRASYPELYQEALTPDLARSLCANGADVLRMEFRSSGAPDGDVLVLVPRDHAAEVDAMQDAWRELIGRPAYRTRDRQRLLRNVDPDERAALRIVEDPDGLGMRTLRGDGTVHTVQATNMPGVIR